jgi:hypothetical protein
MYKDPGIIVRPTDYIKKKAQWVIESKLQIEDLRMKRLEESKTRFEQIGNEDTPIEMNETLTSEGMIICDIIL